jgi:type I restriction enzyme M protein
MLARAELILSFVADLVPIGLLDRYQVAGVIARWWGDTQYDLRSLAAGGFGTVLDGWVTTIIATGDLDHRLAKALVPDHLDAITEARAKVAEIDATIKAATAAAAGDEEGEADSEPEFTADELKTVKKALTAAKKKLKALELAFATTLQAAREQLSPTQEQDEVLTIMRADVTDLLSSYVTAHRQQVIAALEKWWDKYAVTLRDIESDRDAASAKLKGFLQELGYE